MGKPHKYFRVPPIPYLPLTYLPGFPVARVYLLPVCLVSESFYEVFLDVYVYNIGYRLFAVSVVSKQSVLDQLNVALDLQFVERRDRCGCYYELEAKTTQS